MSQLPGSVGSSTGFATSVATFSRKSSFHQAVRDSRNRRVRGLWRNGEVFYARLKVKLDDGRMVDRRVRLKAATLTEARIEHAVLLGDRVAALHQPPSPPVGPTVEARCAPTLREFIPAYLERARLTKRPATVETEKIHLDHYQRGDLARVRLDVLSKRDILKFRDHWLTKGWSHRSANLSVTVLRNLLRCARDEGLLEGNPTEGIRPLRHVPRRRPLFTTAQVERLAEVAQQVCSQSGRVLADFLHVCAFSGVRYGEAKRLCRDNVRWDLRLLVVGADGQTKNHETRFVDFNPRLEAVLKRMKEQAGNGASFLFRSPDGSGKPVNVLRDALNKARRAAGLPSFGFHDCRHHFISYAVMSGIDFMTIWAMPVILHLVKNNPHCTTIARWVGHKDGGILIGKVYGHLSGEHLRAAAARPSLRNLG